MIIGASSADLTAIGAIQGELVPGPGNQPNRAVIPDEIRRSIVALHRITAWTRMKLFALLAVWGVCAALAITVTSFWVRIPCWIFIGLVLHSLGVFMHEGAHGSLFRKPYLDRPIGFLCGLPVFFPCSSYRATHLLHHKFENTALDPDNLEANFPNRTLRAVMYYTWFVIGMPAYVLLVTITGPFRAKGWENKAVCVVEPLLIAAFYTALFTLASRYHFGRVVANGWAWALPCAVLIANFRGLAEHTQLRHNNPPDPFHSTRSLVSNRFVAFFFNNQNHHLEHHLFPGLPWNALGKAHHLLQPVYEQRGASVAKGYLSWIAGAFRYGPNRTMSYRQQRPVLDANPVNRL
jgi:fatty acid desaturase